MLANDGVTVLDVPVWADGTSVGAGQYESLRFFDGIELNAGFVAFATSGSSNTVEELKFEHGVHGTLCPLSSLVSWTIIEDFSNFPADASVPPYTVAYGSPAANLTQTATAPPGVSQSATQDNSTASTLASGNGAAEYQFSPGEKFQMYFQMSSTSATYQTIFIYFSNTNAGGLSNYYRLYIDFKANKCEIQKNGGTLVSTTFSSRPLSTWLIASIDFRQTSGTVISADIVDSTTSLSILNAGLSTTDVSYAGSGFGYYVKSTSGNPIIISDLKKS